MKASILRRALKNEIVRMCKEGLLEPHRGKGVMMIAFKMAGLDKQQGGTKNAFTTPFTPPQQALAQAKANEPKDVESAKQAIRNASTGLKRYDPIVTEADEETPEPDPKKKEKKPAPETPAPEEPTKEPAPEKGAEEKPTGEDPFAKGGEETPPEDAEEKPEAPEEPEEPTEPEDPEQVPAQEDPEEKPIGKEEAKVIIKTLLKLNSKRNSQTIARLSKQIGVSPKRIEDFVYALATKYVQAHVIRQKEK